MKLHHIGYLVKNIEKSIKSFNTIGFTEMLYPDGSSVMFDEMRLCDICFMRLPGTDHIIELVAPKSSESPIWGLMGKYKNTPYHLCFESQNLMEDVEELRNKGWLVFQEPAIAPAIDGHKVVFLMNNSAGIIELVGMDT